ncbi:MAG TPA: hypothetical protein VGO47_06955 [Chlamydiales bacterium]|nr:hypothetical protein [Chlamydiales bacterium]
MIYLAGTDNKTRTFNAIQDLWLIEKESFSICPLAKSIALNVRVLLSVVKV